MRTKSVQECAMEIQDTYVRLDRSIADLLEVLDKKVGLQNVLIFVTSTGYIDSESPDSGLYKVSRRRVLSQPLCGSIEYVPDGYVWRRKVCGSSP